MQTTTTDGKTFTLRRETEADQQLLDQLEHACWACAVDVQRAPRQGGGFTTEAVVIEVDRQGEHGLVAESGRQALSALGQLVSLGLREAAHHGHVGTTPSHPQAQEQFAALLVQVQVMLEALRDVIVKQEFVLQKMHSAHGGPLVVETAIVVEGGAA